MAIRRIFKEYSDICFIDAPPASISASPVSTEDMFTWSASIIGSDKTPYEGGKFYLDIKFPPEYPFKPPQIRFTTKIYHPNINAHGNICMDILYNYWSPALTITKVLVSIINLLGEKDCTGNYNAEATHTFTTNPAQFELTARSYVRKYANEHKDIISVKI